ncbi:hypothetical protein DID80_01300 [Candidatus Marinamargulisbacteria bacterium SCGC AAA071-K20]|nr:hypothetical protein DID80_01300 [Candidatus Marinamargulisbacteria bacterium SCGC AAA071-K20]
MKEKKFLWQLYPSYLIVIAISLVLMFVYTSGMFKTFYIDQTTIDLKARTELVESQAHYFVANKRYDDLSALLTKTGQKVSTRFSIINAKGTVLADSDQEASVMDNHSTRPELILALNGQWGVATRYSKTLQTEMLYVAKPIILNNEVVGAIRSSIPMNNLDDTLALLTKKGLIWAGLICIFSGFVGIAVSRKITKPIAALTKGAEEFSEGNFDYIITAPDTKEFRTLSNSLNNMAGQLKERMRTILKQSQEKESILSNMSEGVITVDKDKKITTINQAAKTYFCNNQADLIGRSVEEVIRNTTIQTLIQKALDNQVSVETDITISHPQPYQLQAQGTCLLDSHNKCTGALIVIHNITHIKKLEAIRTNFVANVSHELKTPVTLIKGFLETLFRGAADNKVERDEFLSIIQDHANRLDAIIEDLLSLSRIEQENNEESIETNTEILNNVIKQAVNFCSKNAQNRHTKLIFNSSKDILSKINFTLMEQAVINLIDNAIKYSPENSTVKIDITQSSLETIITVSDQGVGIPKTHIPHLFERFYRVDKARSREIGGTGLGLSIVKHIAQAHKGSVSVNSKENEGSHFLIHIPTTQSNKEEENNNG